MCFFLYVVCDEEKRVIATDQAPGSCPYCGGKVVYADVESTWKLCCCLPLSVQTKRNFSCTLCSKRLLAYP